MPVKANYFSMENSCQFLHSGQVKKCMAFITALSLAESVPSSMARKTHQGEPSFFGLLHKNNQEKYILFPFSISSVGNICHRHVHMQGEKKVIPVNLYSFEKFNRKNNSYFSKGDKINFYNKEIIDGLFQGIENKDAESKQERMRIFLGTEAFGNISYLLKKIGVKDKEINTLRKKIVKALKCSVRNSKKKGDASLAKNLHPHPKADALSGNGVFSSNFQYLTDCYGLSTASELDLNVAERKDGSKTDTASGGCIWRFPNNDEYYVKKSVTQLMKWEQGDNGLKFIFDGSLTPAEQRYFAEKEVVATRQTALHALHSDAVPEVFLCKHTGGTTGDTQQSEYYVATKMVGNFQELGDILVNRDFIEELLTLHDTPTPSRIEVESITNELHELQVKIKHFKESDPLWHQSSDIKIKNDISRIRYLRKKLVDSLFPKKMKQQLLVHLMNDQVLGELDTVNVWGQNVGFRKSPSGDWQLVAIDRGTSYDSGFWGTAKNKDGFYTSKGQRPFVLQSDKERIFTSESGKYSHKLIQLGKDLSNYPYLEDVEVISGSGESEYERLVILKKLAYQDMILEGNGGSDSAFNKNFEFLSDSYSERLYDRGLMRRDEIMTIDKARREGRINQAGGKQCINRWVSYNPFEAMKIKKLANAKRSWYGLPEIS